MRVLAVFNVDFCEWPLGFLDAIEARGTALRISAVVIIDRTVRDHLRRRAPQIQPLHCVSDLEQEWVDARSHRPLADYEARIGREAVAHIAIADRELSAGWVSGGLFPGTPLRAIGLHPRRRRAYLAGLLEFVLDLFESGGFDVVLSPPPQDAVGVAIARVADRLGVPFLAPKAIGLGSKMCLFDDAASMNPCFRAAFDAPGDPSGSYSSSLDAARAWLAEFRHRPAPPEYMGAARRMTFEAPSPVLLAALAWRTLSRRKPEALAYPYPAERLVFEVRRWLGTLPAMRPRFASPCDVGDAPFAYYALHYEPEMSVSAASPGLTDQLAIVEAISKAIPADWQVVVKEHVPMLGRRSAHFHRRLAGMPNVVAVTPFADGFSLLRDASVVITLTGTVGMESVLLGRPTVFLGPSPIQILGEGSVRCNDLARLDGAIDAARAMGPAGDALLERFLACVFEDSVDLPADLYWGGVRHVTHSLVSAHPAITGKMAERILAALARGR